MTGSGDAQTDGIPFDAVEYPENPEGFHAHSLTEDIPGTEFFPAIGGSLRTEGRWEHRGFRGTARHFLMAREPGGRVHLRFSGSAVSLVRPIDFPAPGPYGPPKTGPLECRVDGGGWNAISHDAGREVLLAAGLPSGAHRLDIRCAGRAPDCWALEGLRAWPARPAVVTGHIDGGPMLVDVRAEISGPADFTRSLRDGRTGRFSLLLPGGGQYEMKLSAPGWRRVSIPLEVGAGRELRLPPIAMQPLSAALPPPRPLSPDEPLVLVACAHCNTWGTEPAEWLACRTGWINAQRPHALLLANEVNPCYVAGALAGTDCPWVITDGNHRQAAFADWGTNSHRDLRVGPARILTAGMGVSGDAWGDVLAGFGDEDRLRIICAYEPFAPPELLRRVGVRLYFYGHNLKRPPYWTLGETIFLRKVDALTFYRIEIGPPHDAAAPVSVGRFVFDRST
jgi:hypothetical protein